MVLNKSMRHILLYGFSISLLILGLKWLQWKFLILENAVDIYIALIAILFTLLGAWVASQLSKRKPVIIEKEIIIQQSKPFVLNQTELDKLNLTDREYQILKLLVLGNSNADIAKQLFLSLSTVKTHVSNLYSKLNVKSRYQAIAKAKRIEIVE